LLHASTLPITQIGRVKASGCCFVGDDFGHRAMLGKRPASAGLHIAGRSGLLNHSPGTVSRKADHGLPYSGAGAAALAGSVRVGRGTDRDPRSSWCEPRQQGCPVAPFGNRLGPLVLPFLVSVPNRTARISSGEHSHDRSDLQLGQCIRMRGVIGRQVDQEPGLDSRGDQAPVLSGDGIAPRTGLWVKAITCLPALAATSSWRSSPSICAPYPGRSPAWA
jgi:hypothetical protein